MITRRGIFATLFGGVAVPSITGPPAGVSPENPQAKATGIVHIEWCSRSRSWKRTDTWVMFSDGDEVGYRRYDDQGKETHYNRYPKMNNSPYAVHRKRGPKAIWPKV